MSEMQEFHDELRSVARDLLTTGPTWEQITAAGWTGMEVPETLDGAGASFAETAVLLEEIGRAASRQSLLGTTLAVAALSDDPLLQQVAAGARTALATGFTVADAKVSGRAEFVLDATEDSTVLLVTDTEILTAPVTVTAQQVLDESRTLGIVTADDAPVTQRWRLPTGIGPRAHTALALDSLGIAEAMLTKTVEYTKIRSQFGRAIGSFQAVKHACADMQVKIAVARQLVSAAVEAITENRDAGTEAQMAKAYATEVAVEVAGKAMQLHGGIGYTWECEVHVYLKRAALNRALFGTPAAHRLSLSDRFIA